MNGKSEKNQVIIETEPTSIEGEEIVAAPEVNHTGEGESEWIDFESDFTFSGEEDSSNTDSPASRKSRDSMLAETVALAQKLSGQKKTKIFQPIEEDFNGDEEYFDKADILVHAKQLEARAANAPSAVANTEKNSEAMAGGCFFATIGLSLVCLLLSFLMLGMPHFPGVLGFLFFELVAVLLLFAAREFLKGWGYPERPFRMGLMGGFLSWEVIIVLFWSMFVTALWKDHTLYLLGDKEASAILISLVGGMGVSVMSFYFIRMIEWARAARFVVGKSGLVFISLAAAGAASAIADLLLFL